MAKKPKIEPYAVVPGSDLADAHALISAFIEQSEAVRGSYYQVELKHTAAGQQLLDATPDVARRFVVAAIEQARHWEELAETIRIRGECELEQLDVYHLPGWEEVWSKRSAVATVAKTLTRR